MSISSATLEAYKHVNITQVEVCRIRRGRNAGNPYWRFYDEADQPYIIFDLFPWRAHGHLRNDDLRWGEIGAKFAPDSPIPATAIYQRGTDGKPRYELIHVGHVQPTQPDLEIAYHEIKTESRRLPMSDNGTLTSIQHIRAGDIITNVRVSIGLRQPATVLYIAEDQHANYYALLRFIKEDRIAYHQFTALDKLYVITDQPSAPYHPDAHPGDAFKYGPFVGIVRAVHPDSIVADLRDFGRFAVPRAGCLIMPHAYHLGETVIYHDPEAKRAKRASIHALHRDSISIQAVGEDVPRNVAPHTIRPYDADQMVEIYETALRDAGFNRLRLERDLNQAQKSPPAATAFSELEALRAQNQRLQDELDALKAAPPKSKQAAIGWNTRALIQRFARPEQIAAATDELDTALNDGWRIQHIAYHAASDGLQRIVTIKQFVEADQLNRHINAGFSRSAPSARRWHDPAHHADPQGEGFTIIGLEDDGQPADYRDAIQKLRRNQMTPAQFKAYGDQQGHDAARKSFFTDFSEEVPF